MIDLINLALVMQMLIVWVGGAKCFMVLEFRPRVATVTTPEFISYLIYRIFVKIQNRGPELEIPAVTCVRLIAQKHRY